MGLPNTYLTCVDDSRQLKLSLEAGAALSTIWTRPESARVTVSLCAAIAGLFFGTYSCSMSYSEPVLTAQRRNDAEVVVWSPTAAGLEMAIVGPSPDAGCSSYPIRGAASIHLNNLVACVVQSTAWITVLATCFAMRVHFVAITTQSHNLKCRRAAGRFYSLCCPS